MEHYNVIKRKKYLKMKKIKISNEGNSPWSIFGLFIAYMLMFSCGNDDDTPIIIKDDDNGDDSGFDVSDGRYIMFIGVDGDSTVRAGMKLNATNVNGAGIGETASRDGYSTVYAYLAEGNYIFADIEDKKVAGSFGGTLSRVGGDDWTVDDGNNLTGGYDEVVLTSGGASFNIGAKGIYQIIFDDQTDKAYIFKIERWGIIGDAVGGWSEDIPMKETSSSVTGATWQGTGIVIRSGMYKVRHNDTWSFKAKDVDETTDFEVFTNLGGTIAALEAGGANLSFEEEDATYTVELSLDEFGEFDLSLEKTGDAPEITFDPDDFKWGIIGDATANKWNADRNMIYTGEFNGDGAHYWRAVITFAETGKFKFRANDAWDTNLGGTLASDGSSSTLTTGGDDIPSPGNGAYYIVVQTADEGSTWTATMNAAGWGIIGAATPTGWDTDTDLTADGFDDSGVTTYSVVLDLTVDEYKFRANDARDLDLGGDLNDLTHGGANLTVPASPGAGNYMVTLTFDGEAYSASLTIQ